MIDFGPEVSVGPPGLVQSLNVPRTVAAAISARAATLHELDTVYGVEDLYDLLEVHSVDAHNRALMAKED